MNRDQKKDHPDHPTSDPSQTIHVMVVDDDESVREILQAILISLGYETVGMESAAAAVDYVAHNPVDIAILDYQLPDLNRTELMLRLREINPGLLTLIVTGYGTIERAVEAMQAGAWDFLAKPITVNMLQEKLERCKEHCFLCREHDFRRKINQREFAFSGVIGPSAAMEPVYEALLRAAQSSLPVLIEGETGVGKEYIAKAIHLNSNRKNKPFVVMDCTAIPQSLIESVLFGSLKGAFTGAVERKGLLEEAHEGVLFLDEIAEIAPDIQPKLLRCLETKRFRPVGGTKEKQSDFRILCATNRDLHAETPKGNFRADLFYRISALRIVVPPLRERPSDIPVMARHFLQEIATEYRRDGVEFTPEALRALQTFSWPGNIRQLKFTIESAFFGTTDSRIGPEHLPLEKSESKEAVDPKAAPMVDVEKDFKSFRDEALLDLERSYIRALLEKTEGEVRKAAKLAGLTREALYRVMNRCGLSPNEFRKKSPKQSPL